MNASKRLNKFAFYSPDMRYPWGGSEVLWSSVAALMAEAGYEVSACIQNWGELESHRIGELSKAGVSVCRRPKSLAGARSLYQRLQSKLFATSRFVDHWRNENDESLVVISLPINTSVCAPLFAKQKFPRRYVLIVQAAFDFSWPKGAQRDLMRQIYSNAERVFFVSQHNRELTECQLALRLRNAVVIFNPYTVVDNAPLQHPRLDRVLKIACVARLETGIKGHQLMLRALARSQWKSRAVEVSLVGSGPDKADLQQIVEMFELANVRFLSQIDSIEHVWKDHHMGILTSRGEGMPLSVLEGMGCGRPFVVSGGTWARELINDGIDGFISAELSVDGVDAALEKAWAQRRELGEIGKAAYRKIADRVPRDPVKDLCDRLLEISLETNPHSPERIRGI